MGVGLCKKCCKKFLITDFSWQTAIARGVEIYAEVLGYGLSSDAHHITAGRDDGEGAAKAMMSAAR